MPFNWEKHKEVMLKILNDIYSDISIAPLLGFKGGTAALLFYDLDRASVDLDFDLLEEGREDFVFEKIKKILQEYGTIKDEKIKNFNIFFMLAYFGKESEGQNIKVEINRRNFGCRYEIMNNLGVSMKVMAQSDMAANKLVAMHDRIGKTNRDIFDVYFFLHKGWDVNRDIISLRTGLEYAEFLSTLIADLEKMNASILGGLGQLVTEKQKAWIRVKLKSETLFLLRLELQSEKERKQKE